MTTAASQQAFVNLRKRLDQLGYRQPLGIESLPLVEKLFADLLHTTDSLKRLKLDFSRVPEEKATAEVFIEPYKSDNAKLVRENNELHQELIKHKEETEALVRDLKKSLWKMEHESADLKFLNNQYVQKMKQLEKESKLKSDKIVQLQEKNFQAVVQTPGGQKKPIPFRRQRMEIDTLVPPSEDSLTSLVAPVEDQYLADLLRVADNNLAAMKAENAVLREQRDALEDKVNMFRKQIDNRDEEVSRMKNLLEGGRPYDVVALEARNRSNERLISHLNIQIDYLQQKTQELQRQLDDSSFRLEQRSAKTGHLEGRNAVLEKELKDVDFMAQRVQAEKDVVIRTADREIEQAKSEVESSRREIQLLASDVATLRTENTRLSSELENTRRDVANEGLERARLQDLLEKVQADKKRLSGRVSKLLETEKDLVLEIDRLKHHRNGTVHSHSHNKKAGKDKHIEDLLRGLEQERDYYKNEVSVLQQLLKPRSRSPSPSGRVSRSSTPAKRIGSPSPSRLDKKTSSQYDSIIRVLEEERDRYKKEVDLLKTSRSRPTSPFRSLTKDDESELKRVQRERDDLQSMLGKFERHMAEIQANVKVMTGERDKLSQLYEEAREELTRLRRDVMQSPKTRKTSLAAQTVLRQVENERNDALGDVRRLLTERDTLRERLKISTEAQLAERARLEQRIEDLEAELHSVERERGELEVKSRSLEKQVRLVTDDLTQKSVRLETTMDDANQQKANAAQMRMLAEHAETSLQDAQQQLARKEALLRQQEEKGVRLEQRVAELESLMKKDLEQISRLRATVGALDGDKDSLQMTVDEKTEKVVVLNDELGRKEKLIDDLRHKIADLELALDRSSEALSAKEREVTSVRRQLDNTSDELAEVGRAREVALRENRRLHEDLATMTRENQSLNMDNQQLLEERETLKVQVQDYVREVKRVEDLLSGKEQERTDLLDQYRSLTADYERTETQTHQLASESSNLRLEISTRDSEIRRLRDRCENLDRELQKYMHSNHQTELHASQMTKHVADVEAELRQTQDEKQMVLDDLRAVRDLCAKLEMSKDSLQRQLTAKTLDIEKLQATLDDMEQEHAGLRAQVGNERSSVKSLEGILQSNREKEFQASLALQEKATELQLVRDRLALCESKIDQQTRELSNLRTRNIELESDVEKTKRQLTNERFDKERALQELRRQGIRSPVVTSSQSPAVNRYTPSPTSNSRPRSPDQRVRSPLRSRSPGRLDSEEA